MITSLTLHFPLSTLHLKKAQELSIPADSYLVPLNKNKGLLENKKETQ